MFRAFSLHCLEEGRIEWPKDGTLRMDCHVHDADMGVPITDHAAYGATLATRCVSLVEHGVASIDSICDMALLRCFFFGNERVGRV